MLLDMNESFEWIWIANFSINKNSSSIDLFLDLMNVFSMIHITFRKKIIDLMYLENIDLKKLIYDELDLEKTKRLRKQNYNIWLKI